MDKKNLLNYNDPDAIPGVICKNASVKNLEVTEDDLKKINKYTLSPLKAEDVFVFKAMIADNEQDDRNYMPFNLKALQDLKKLYPGKTMLMDHNKKADNQIARIFDTELIQNPNKTTEIGELHTELMAKIYMLNNENNKNIIAEIKGGIKKEVSTSCSPEKMICSICGVDNVKDYCRHYPGFEYDVSDSTGKTSKKKCKMLLHGAKEAYELSFVALPAQPRAGTHKSIGFTKPVMEKVEKNQIKNKEEKQDFRDLELRAKSIESFIFAENEGGNIDE